MTAAAATKSKAISDDDLLHIVADERRRSVGFDHDAVLRREREMALEYRKGVMKDVPALPNRSKAVSTDVADAIEMLMAKLVPIFTEGDDVAEFVARGPGDDDQAKLESDYVAWVVFQQNPGFLVLESFFRDALESKVGVVKVWWEDAPEAKAETREGVPASQAAVAMLTGKATAAEPSSASQTPADDSGSTQDEPLFDLTLPMQTMYGRVRIQAWPPEDFTVASDCVWLQETTYCAARSRPRAQDVKMWKGIDPADVDDLPGYDLLNQEMELARDTAGEHLQTSTSSDSIKDLRQVQIVEHFIRLVEDGECKLYRVLTGDNETVLLYKEEVDRLPFAAITPFQVSHRFYGESVADKVMELQRIKTALTRAGLDSIYFALNQRMGIVSNGANEFTIPDLLDNRPGMPVRMEKEGAVFSLASGGLKFGELAAGLEYFSTVTEERTGIVRSAQGLNPDTLHDTASGAAMLNAAANERIRYIARRFGETGVKDIYLITHYLLRKHAENAQPAKLGGDWQTPSPMEWAARHDVSIEVGVGSGDRAQSIAGLNQVLELQQKAVEAQGGVSGPLVTAQNVYAAATDLVSKLGSKRGPTYFSDPSQAPPQPPKPDPEAAKAQVQAQMEQAKLQSTEKIAGQRAQQDATQTQQNAVLDAHRLAFEQRAHGEKMALEHRKLDVSLETARLQAQVAASSAAGRIGADRDRTTTDAAVKTHAAELGAHTTLTVAAMHDQTQRDVQASESEDVRRLDDDDRG